MKRRQFIAGLAGAAAWPGAAWAQQQTMPVIGFLHAGSLAGTADYVHSFLEGLAQIGYIEGRNVAIDYRWADGQSDRLPALARELVRRQVAVIVASGSTHSAHAAADATSTIPIVFHIADDPVETGLVASLNRPGAYRTGVTSFTSLLVPKRLELLHEAAPRVSTISVLLNPMNAKNPSSELQEAARALGLQLHVVYASTDREIEIALASVALMQDGSGCLR
jgi:ABC-type uncharacterized transport system substrate-binding protein